MTRLMELFIPTSPLVLDRMQHSASTRTPAIARTPSYPACGRRMGMQSHKKRSGKGGHYFYYRWAKRRSEEPDACTNHRHWRAEKLEGQVFGVVRDFFVDCERMKPGLA